MFYILATFLGGEDAVCEFGCTYLCNGRTFCGHSFSKQDKVFCLFVERLRIMGFSV